MHMARHKHEVSIQWYDIYEYVYVCMQCLKVIRGAVGPSSCPTTTIYDDDLSVHLNANVKLTNQFFLFLLQDSNLIKYFYNLISILLLFILNPWISFL